MRGVVSLAAALALPAALADGSPFPHRNLIVFLTFCVIFVTLVLQGITLPPLIRAFGLAGGAGPNCEEQEARRIVIEAVLSHLEEAKSKDSEESAGLYDDLARHYRQRLASIQPASGSENGVDDHSGMSSFPAKRCRIERDTAVLLRNEGRINDEVLRRIERELDLSESRFALTVTGDR